MQQEVDIEAYSDDHVVAAGTPVAIDASRLGTVFQLSGGVLRTHIRHRGLDSEEDRQFYFSYQQFTDGRIALVVRSRADVRGMTPAVLQAIRSLDPEQPVYDVRTMDDVLARSAAERWLNTAIIGVFAVSSLLLAGVGLYGVIACSVTERLREFGVRMALGAMPSEVSRLVLRKGTVLAASGAALGLGGAIALARAMESLLFGVPPSILSVLLPPQRCCSVWRSPRATSRRAARRSRIRHIRFGPSDEREARNGRTIRNLSTPASRSRTAATSVVDA